MKPITQSDITEAAKSPATMRELCGTVAANLMEAAPTLSLSWSDSGVFYLRADGAIVMIYSWTIFGDFRRCNPALDVTQYVNRAELSTLGAKPPALP